jgi:CheY-specific phosphatase CheX
MTNKFTPDILDRDVVSQRAQARLESVGLEVFESMAFMFSSADEPPSAAPGEASPAGALVTATVSFDGPVPGQVVLSVSRNMLPALASNMLGLDDGVAPSGEQQADALKEFLNVLCGNLLPALLGTEAEAHVHSPAIASDESLLRRSLGEPVTSVHIPLDSGVADLALYIAGDATELTPPSGIAHIIPGATG